MKAKALKARRPETGGSIAVAVSVMGLVLLAGLSTAGAQFLCPTPTPGGPAEGVGLDIAVGTVVIAIDSEPGPPGGEAGITANMSGGDDRVGSVFFDVCFDDTKLDLEEALQPQGSCTLDGRCPGDQVCECPGEGECAPEARVCKANVVTTCHLDDRLADAHRLVATSPVIPENSEDPGRLRIAVLDATSEAAECTVDEDCDDLFEICLSGRCVLTCDADEDCDDLFEICLSGRCIPTCGGDEDCEPGNHCKVVADREEMVCSPINIVDDGALVRCTFDIFASAPTGDAGIDFALIEVADDSIPSALPLRSEGQGGAISILPCPTAPCPEEKVCVDGVCLTPTPTPTHTPTPTETYTPTPCPSATPCPTDSARVCSDPPQNCICTCEPHTPTPTLNLGATATPTPTTARPTTVPPTTVPTTTAPPTGGSETPTPTVTATATGSTGGGGGCNCQIVGSEEAHPLHAFLILLVPAMILWARKRRY